MARKINHEAVLVLWSQGMPGAEIADLFGCTARSVRRIAQKARQAGDVRGKPQTERMREDWFARSVASSARGELKVLFARYDVETAARRLGFDFAGMPTRVARAIKFYVEGGTHAGLAA